MKGKDIYMYGLGSLIALGFFAILALIIFREFPSPNKELLYMMLGILGAKFSDVVGYFYGSSKGSSDKNELLGSKPPTP